MNRRDIILALAGLAGVILVADLVDRWALSYPLLRDTDVGDAANPAALWSLEIGRFLLALTLVVVAVLVLRRPPNFIVALAYAAVGALGSSARPALLLTHGDVPLVPPSIVLWAASGNMLKAFAFSGLLAVGIAAFFMLCTRRT